MTDKLFLYTRFERFWHWAQATLVLALIYTGFEIHGTFNLVGFRRAVYWHDLLAWTLVVLTAFAIFWHFTTGAWMQYLPTRRYMREMIRYYLLGIFRNESHPTRKTELTKLNPLQRATYLSLKILVFPVQLASGFAYYYHDELVKAGIGIPLGPVAFLHTAGAFILVIFVIAHVYLATTGHTLSSNLRAMFTGWEKVPREAPGHPPE
jgi:thiosulfate reductase cytochrome b subunit